MSVVEKTIRKLQEARALSGESEHRPNSPNLPSNALPQSADAPERRYAKGAGITVERGNLYAAGLLPPQEDAPLLTRQYRKIKRPLIANAMSHEGARAPNAYLVMIASAVAGEGKTFTAVNLALSMALERDIRVLLVDADVAKPQLSDVLGLREAPGLLDALRATDVDVETLIRPTDLATLAVLPAGKGAEEATELLSSDRMARIAEALGRNDSHRIVVFDSPPLLQTTESSALARIVGQVIVVVRAEFTPQPVVRDALATLEGHPGVSVILNQSMRSVTSAYYYYGYRAERSDANGNS